MYAKGLRIWHVEYLGTLRVDKIPVTNTPFHRALAKRFDVAPHLYGKAGGVRLTVYGWPPMMVSPSEGLRMVALVGLRASVGFVEEVAWPSEIVCARAVLTPRRTAKMLRHLNAWVLVNCSRISELARILVSESAEGKRRRGSPDL